ncbi:peptidase inhibitor family I36 protein [Streptomyces sp. NPDC060035]|uniref:peptidase inhibitor family I36 protein n=1 Tax=Streptomyces sp. NPDC060035 TaxID=3347044 RepID=UPI003677F815
MVTLVGLAAAPASASAGDCSFTKTLCLFSGENFTGERITLSSLAPGGTCINLDESGWGVPARSAINTHSQSAALFASEDCAGGPDQVSGGSSRADLGSFVPVSVWVAG